MQIGDRVKPVETFNFGVFNGPDSLDDLGTVQSLDIWGDVNVLWDNGKEDVHVVQGSEYDLENEGAHSRFGVVPA